MMCKLLTEHPFDLEIAQLERTRLLDVVLFVLEQPVGSTGLRRRLDHRLSVPVLDSIHHLRQRCRGRRVLIHVVTVILVFDGVVLIDVGLILVLVRTTGSNDDIAMMMTGASLGRMKHGMGTRRKGRRHRKGVESG
jgi:hypothetical protein